MESQIRWGILSTGKISTKFASEFIHAPHASLVAVASRDQLSSDDFGNQFSIPFRYSSYEDLYRSPEIDAIYIGTPHTLHYENAKNALENGKHVLCEKPMTMTPEESASLFEIAKSKQLFIMEGLWTYFLPAFRLAREWVGEGKIGEVNFIQANFGFAFAYDAENRLFKQELGGGTLMDMSIYPLCVPHFYDPSYPIDVKATADMTSQGTPVDKSISLILQNTNFTSSLHSSFDHAMRNEACIYGFESFILLPKFWSAQKVEIYDVIDREPVLREEITIPHPGGGLHYELEAASQSILAGDIENEWMPWSETLYFQKILQDIRSKVGISFQ